MTSTEEKLRPDWSAFGPARSKDGYTFDVHQNRWKLNKDITVYLGRAAQLEEPTQSGFRATLQRYAEEMSAVHTRNLAHRFNRFLNDTGASVVDAESLLNWRAKSDE